VRTRILLAICLVVPALAFAQAPVSYRLSFPAPEHRWMQVDVTFPDLPQGVLQLRMSRSSPGRYALHEFAKNVFDVRISNGAGTALIASRPNLHQWDIDGHDGTVRVTYKIFGDRVDGTYLAIDSTHAHINMPSALMWARGLDMRPATVRFEPPAGSRWQVATQLMPGSDAHTFSAPNLQYLLDSPSELSAFSLRSFTVEDAGRTPSFRIALHHAGSDADADAYARETEKIVREMKHVYGEYPQFENNTYTFIADYLPWANGDGMEHRNSTILSSSGALESARLGLLGTVSHEFFHAWNVERIRPKSLEPFNFEDANVSGELWLAEGFTSYYGPLVMQRAGLTSLADYARSLANTINAVTLSPGRQVRTAEEMSRFAPFVDAAAAIDRTSFDNTFISYYTWGAAIGLGLDLSLRDRSEGAVTLDHFMRVLWQQFGKSGEPVPGYVGKPYTMADLKATLASVSGDKGFADAFFEKFIQGHEVVDYQRLLGRAGLVTRLRNRGAAFAGDLALQPAQGGLRVASAVPFGSPAYEAGLERDDLIVAIDGKAVDATADFDAALQSRKPGQSIGLRFERRGAPITATLRLVEDPRIDIVPAEDAGQALTDAQRRFRVGWLSSRSPVAQSQRPAF
jgi:predicted metalloprotease with PDZ domain